MAKDYTKIDASRLMGDITKTEADIAQSEKETDGMFAAVAELNKMWQGPANEAFNQQFIDDYNRMKNYLSNLKKYAQRLREDKTAYESCESRVREKVNALKI